MCVLIRFYMNVSISVGTGRERNLHKREVLAQNRCTSDTECRAYEGVDIVFLDTTLHSLSNMCVFSRILYPFQSKFVQVNLTTHELELQASDGRKNFNLHLRFFEEIDPDSSSWSLGSVGRMVFTIRKKQEEVKHKYHTYKNLF